MAEIRFMYKKESHTYPCKNNDLIKDIFELYSKKISIEIDSLSFEHKNKKIEYDDHTLIGDKFDIEHISNCCSNKKTIKIRVKRTPFYINFFHKNQQPVSLNAKETDKMKKIFSDYATKANKKYGHIYFLYNNNYYSYFNIGNRTVIEFANYIDKKSSVMSITVTDSEEESKEILNEESKKLTKEESKEIINEESKEKLTKEESKEIINEESKEIINEESKEIKNKESKEILSEESKEVLNKESKEIINEESKKDEWETVPVEIKSDIPDNPKIYYFIMFNYEGVGNSLKVEEDEKMKDVIKKYTNSTIKVNDPDSFVFLYNGNRFFMIIKENKI